MIERVEKLIKALLCKIEAYVAKVESIEDCCNGIDRNYVNKDGDSMQGLLELEAGVNFNDLDSGYNGHLDTEDLDDDVVWVFPNASGTIALTSDLFSCADLTGCPEIAEIINTIPTDVSELNDSGGVLFSGDYNDLDNKPTIPTNNSELVNDSGYLTCEDLEGCSQIEIIRQDIIDIENSIPTDVSELTDVSNLFFDGDYNSLDNLPSIPTNNSELLNDSNYLTCEDLEHCQEIIDIKDSIPTDVSDLSDTNKILLEYKGEQSSTPLSPQKGWFYKSTVDGVMYYFDGANWIAYTEGRGKEWQLQFFNQTIIIQLEATPNNIVTFTTGVGTDVGTIEVSTDGVTYSPLVFPFSPSVGTLYFKRLNNMTTGVYTISE